MFREWWQALRRYLFEQSPQLALGIFILAFLLVYFSSNIFYNIAPGNYGVLWKRFGGGTQIDRPPYGEGLHIIFPWDKIFIYDGRLQLLDHNFDVLSADGLTMSVDISYRFELVANAIPDLNKYIGPTYQDIAVTPEVGARARDVFALNTTEEIFSGRREVIQKTMAEQIQKGLDEAFNPPWRKGQVRFVKIWDVLIRSIKLPPYLEAAIENKNIAQQRNEQYDFQLLSESKEAERKRIEAHGIKDFQDIVAPGLTENYLRWRGIEATLALANSTNSKIIVVGGKDGLPLILNTGGGVQGLAPNTIGTAPPPPTSPPAGTGSAPGAPASGALTAPLPVAPPRLPGPPASPPPAASARPALTAPTRPAAPPAAPSAPR